MPTSKFLRGVCLGLLMGCAWGALVTYAIVRSDVAEAQRTCDEYVDTLLREFSAGEFEDTTE